MYCMYLCVYTQPLLIEGFILISVFNSFSVIGVQRRFQVIQPKATSCTPPLTVLPTVDVDVDAHHC